MPSLVLIIVLSFCFFPFAAAQEPQDPDQKTAQGSQSDQQKSRERSAEAGESSSRDTRIDVTPPKEDAKDHPNKKVVPPTSSPNPEDMTDMTGDVQEMHPWNPYRAAKDDEVGDYYFKTGNYKGALARYQDALVYKDNDAVANFKMAECYQKLGQPEEAIPHYQAYLKILPEGPFSKQAKKALKKLGAPETPSAEKVSSKSSPQ